MEAAESGRLIRWYRTPLDRDVLARLNTRSDARGMAQALGHILALALAGAGVLFSAGRWPWWSTLLLLFAYGTVGAFVTNPASSSPASA